MAPTIISNNEHSKINLKFCVLALITFGPGGEPSRNIHVTYRKTGMTMWAQILGPAPLEFGKAETVQISALFWTTSDFTQIQLFGRRSITMHELSATFCQ